MVMIEIRSSRKDDKLDDLIVLSRDFFAEYESHQRGSRSPGGERWKAEKKHRKRLILNF
jgi:hypothetical protein